MWRLFLLLLVPAPGQAESLIAAHTIRAHSTLTADDIAFDGAAFPGAATNPDQVIGLEAKNVIYAGKPIFQTELGPNAIVERNQIVALSYSTGGLSILTEGRALDRGGVGEYIQVMNLTSRSKVIGQIGADAVVNVTP